MWIIDSVTGEKVLNKNLIRVVVDHVHGCVVFGYVGDKSRIITILVYIEDCGLQQVLADKILMKKHLIFSKKSGYYMSEVDLPEYIRIRETSILGQGKFPYDFEKKYEAIDNFKLFNGKQQVLRYATNPISKHLKYTFGIEFETSQGYIPEDICFRDGLIPLRDGSITGLEYSTVVMGGNKGICLLKQQLNTLRQYTNFNKECSLHIHMGGFPIEPNALYRVYLAYKKCEEDIDKYIPELTFRSGLYKENGKDYCKKLPLFNSFDQLYKSLVGVPFLGDLRQPHPKDLQRKRKWNITTRYYALNLINAICYNVNKTIEFRFLRPTYNFNKIILWLYIFNAILRFAEEHTDRGDYYNLTIQTLLDKVYPSPIKENLQSALVKLNCLTINQNLNNDKCGQFTNLEDKLFVGDMGY